MIQRVAVVPVPPWQAAVAAVAAVSVALAGSEDGPVVCPWRRCTGAYCPGCGATRSARSLLVGDIAGSWRLHPMVLVVAVQVALYLALRLIRPAQARRLAGPALPLVLGLNGVAVVGVWVIRLATGAIPGFGG